MSAEPLPETFLDRVQAAWREGGPRRLPRIFAEYAFAHFLYRLPHWSSRLMWKLYVFPNKRRPPEYDLVLIHPEDGQGWILEAICREIVKHYPGTWKIHHSRFAIPIARSYFIAHYAMLPDCLKLNPHMHGSVIRTWFTHPRFIRNLTRQELAYSFNQTGAIATCGLFKELLQSWGVRPERISVVLGAADPELFPRHQRGNGAVGFSTAYYERKNPEMILEIIRRLPHRKFILLGRGWEEFPRYAELRQLPNLTYLEVPYSEYPKYYAQMDVFVSPAKLEGGPIPLLEAMMANVVPVASRTGFAPDIIRHGENGFIFDVNAPVQVVCDQIERAFAFQGDVRASVEHLSWRNFSREIQKVLHLPPPSRPSLAN
jgi:glycosyltransferase involved in cell wall biosynthesis